MRIYGPNGTTPGPAATNVRRTSSTGFALPEDAASTPESRAVMAPKTAANIDALLAMQGIEDPVERRKRSVQRGKGALDVLDDLKIGLLSGQFQRRHREPAAGRRRQPQILLRRSRPRCGPVRDRAPARSGTGQGRAVLMPAAIYAQLPAGKLPQCTVSSRPTILSVTTCRYIRRARTDPFSSALHVQMGWPWKS